MRLTGMWVVAALVGVAGEASAENGSSHEQAACRPDVRRLCGHIGRADNQKYSDCLQIHFSEVSQKCQQVLMNHQNQH